MLENLFTCQEQSGGNTYSDLQKRLRIRLTFSEIGNKRTIRRITKGQLNFFEQIMRKDCLKNLKLTGNNEGDTRRDKKQLITNLWICLAEQVLQWIAKWKPNFRFAFLLKGHSTENNSATHVLSSLDIYCRACFHCLSVSILSNPGVELTITTSLKLELGT